MLPWQQCNGCHPVSFVTYVSGAKFEEHCSDIPGDIPAWECYCLSWCENHYLPSLHNTKNVNISKAKEDIPKWKSPLLFVLKSLSNTIFCKPYLFLWEWNIARNDPKWLLKYHKDESTICPLMILVSRNMWLEIVCVSVTFKHHYNLLHHKALGYQLSKLIFFFM